MADRTVAGLAGRPKRRTKVVLPTGSIVST
jgi:hypothetical protein